MERIFEHPIYLGLQKMVREYGRHLFHIPTPSEIIEMTDLIVKARMIAEVDLVMDMVNSMFEAHGVECIDGDKALYVNVGDIYLPTLFYDFESFTVEDFASYMDRKAEE
jgi:hypothetical protein